MVVYMDLCDKIRAFKWKQGPQSINPVTNKPLDKMPSSPKKIDKYGRCYCSQLRANPLIGAHCPVKMGTMVPDSYSESFLFFVHMQSIHQLKNYHIIMTVYLIGVKQKYDGVVQSRDFLQCGLNAHWRRYTVSR